MDNKNDDKKIIMKKLNMQDSTPNSKKKKEVAEMNQADESKIGLLNQTRGQNNGEATPKLGLPGIGKGKINGGSG